VLIPVLLTPVLAAPASVSHAQTSSPRSPAPSSKPVSARNTGAPKITGPHKPAPNPVTCAHTVRRGEALSRIAVRYKVSRQSLIDANRLVNPAALRAGQRLVVPGCRATPPPGGVDPDLRLTEPLPEGTVVKRVGPRRILTALVLAEPDFQDERLPMVWPVAGPVISTFGQRSRGWHAGIDITADVGSHICAAAPGTVIYSGWIRAYGQVVKIEHNHGFITLYAHNLNNMVEAGDQVEAGQVIATVGRSGHATGPHVHFEVRRDGKAYNPLHLLEPSDQSPVFEDDVAASSSDLDPHE
jgi:murein DD-endopeptidase MepM/ murein hydrolase activator NlpD